MNYKNEPIINKPNFNRYSVHKLICSCNIFYIGKLVEVSKLNKTKHVLEIELKTFSSKSF